MHVNKQRLYKHFMNKIKQKAYKNLYWFDKLIERYHARDQEYFEKQVPTVIQVLSI